VLWTPHERANCLENTLAIIPRPNRQSGFNGLIDADLGGQVVKKRVGFSGRGKRGGARTIVATKFAGRWFFLFGFGKNEKANIDKDELKLLQEVARDLLDFSEAQLQAAILVGELTEVCDDGGET